MADLATVLCPQHGESACEPCPGGMGGYMCSRCVDQRGLRGLARMGLLDPVRLAPEDMESPHGLAAAVAAHSLTRNEDDAGEGEVSWPTRT